MLKLDNVRAMQTATLLTRILLILFILYRPLTLIFPFFALMQSTVKIGISIAGVFNYQLEPNVSALACTSCSTPLKFCVNLHHSFPGNYVEIYAWYQLRSVKWCSRKVWSIKIVSSVLLLNDLKLYLVCNTTTDVARK